MAGQCANPPGRRHREQLPLWAALQLSAFSSKILLNYDVTRPPPRTAHQTTRHGHVALAATLRVASNGGGEQMYNNWRQFSGSFGCAIPERSFVRSRSSSPDAKKAETQSATEHHRSESPLVFARRR